MSYQSRSRAKSITDETAFQGGDGIGKCCFADGTSTETSYYDCLSKSGAFFQDVDASCPSLGPTGCCCSCSGVESYVEENGEYIFTGGLRITSRCGCQEECGVFHEGISCEEIEDNIDAACTKYVDDDNSYDVRYPYACCHPEVNELGQVTGWNCLNVCTAQDCIDLAPDNLSGFCPNVFYGINCDDPSNPGSGRMCDINPYPDFREGPVDCYENSCSSDDLCEEGEAIGACCLFDIITFTVTCAQTTENQCANTSNDVTITCWGGCGVECYPGICPDPPEPGSELQWCGQDPDTCDDDADCPDENPYCCGDVVDFRFCQSIPCGSIG